MIFLVTPIVYYIRRAKKGLQIPIRHMPGVNAIDEAIGRSVELGRPISFTTGLTNVSPLFYACLGVLRHVARKAATFGSRLIIPISDPEVLAITDATAQNAYRDARKTAQYDPTALRFLSTDQLAFASGYMGLMHREKPGCAFLFGSFAGESLILAESGQQVGAIQVAATVSPEQIPFFISTCDYTLIGEELYAVGAYLSRDPVQTGSLRGQDIGKGIFLAIILFGVIQATLASMTLTKNTSLDSSSTAPLPIVQWLETPWESVLKKFGLVAPANDQ